MRDGHRAAASTHLCERGDERDADGRMGDRAADRRSRDAVRVRWPRRSSLAAG